MRFSLRELFLIIFCVAITIAGVLVGPPVSWIGILVFSLIILSKLIDSLVLPRCDRHFATGFCVAAIAYMATCLSLGSAEFSPYADALDEAYLPSSRIINHLMRPQFEWGVSPDSDGWAREANAKSVFPLGHLATACLLGYAGGRYATFMFQRAVRKEDSE